ncbi:hypothetical protein ACFY7H_13965 [Streptomyces sp. NPDC012794]|uniref:hypothetical protein n=1 Tax=Streptomyces sp. NPDC012794 TaxID=3364850 RepID=UPI0036866BC7
MTASEKSDNTKSTGNGSRSSSNGTTTRRRATRAARAGSGSGTEAKETVAGTLTALPAPLAERTHAAVQAVRGTLGNAGRAWTAIRNRKALAAAAAGGTAAVITSTYAIGRRAGLRRRGPLSRLTGGRI